MLPSLPVGRRVAFDAERGRLWVVCLHCGRWNLTPLEERWEAIEDCERRFRGTPLRVSTDNIGLARLSEGLELIRIGRALLPEIAAWRYGRSLLGWPRRLPGGATRVARLVRGAARRGADAVAAHVGVVPGGYDAVTWMRIRRRWNRIVDVVPTESGGRAVVRYSHLDETALVRPDPSEPWRLLVAHDGGTAVLSGDDGLRRAGKLLAAVNGRWASGDDVRGAIARLEDAGRPDGYFARVLSIAMRTAWGRVPDAPALLTAGAQPADSSEAERLALHITKRSFWGRGAVGSEPRTVLPRLPLVDRLALEMAANEDAERRAMRGELAALEAAWKEAEEIAEIADSLHERAPRLTDFPRWRPRLASSV